MSGHWPQDKKVHMIIDCEGDVWNRIHGGTEFQLYTFSEGVTDLAATSKQIRDRYGIESLWRFGHRYTSGADHPWIGPRKYTKGLSRDR